MSSEAFELATTGRVPEFDLADRLRKSLRESDLGVGEMAEYLETSRNTIGNWINGHTSPRPAELKMWALRTGVDYGWLASGFTSRSDPQRSHYGSEAPGYTPVHNEVTALAKPIGSSDEELRARLSSGIPVSSVLSTGQVVNS